LFIKDIYLCVYRDRVPLDMVKEVVECGAIPCFFAYVPGMPAFLFPRTKWSWLFKRKIIYRDTDGTWRSRRTFKSNCILRLR